MHLHFNDEEEAFRREIAAWLADNLSGEFAALRGRGGRSNGSPRAAGPASAGRGSTAAAAPRSASR
jgi:hypothetical protein